MCMCMCVGWYMVYVHMCVQVYMLVPTWRPEMDILCPVCPIPLRQGVSLNLGAVLAARSEVASVQVAIPGFSCGSVRDLNSDPQA